MLDRAADVDGNFDMLLFRAFFAMLFVSGCDGPATGVTVTGGSDASASVERRREDAGAAADVEPEEPPTDCVAHPDADGDGARAIACGGDDCDDADPRRYPGANERCDEVGHDEDCDETTFGFRDNDDDGYGDARCCNGATCGNDCDDANAVVHPTEAESCDTLDNDCDGAVDEDVSGHFFRDADGDDFGDPMTPVTACHESDGVAAMGTDCDDADPNRNPGASEATDGVDNDCDGMLGVAEDEDRDGFAPIRLGGLDCEDRPDVFDIEHNPVRGADVHPGAAERCQRNQRYWAPVSDPWPIVGWDGVSVYSHLAIDYDCDGSVGDDDADGFHAIGYSCVPSDDEVVFTDCNDSDEAVSPAALETCNGIDDNCDAEIDSATASLDCAFPGAEAMCLDGTCAIAACSAGFMQCDGESANGCEGVLLSSRNCGGCGRECGYACDGAGGCDEVVGLSAWYGTLMGSGRVIAEYESHYVWPMTGVTSSRHIVQTAMFGDYTECARADDDRAYCWYREEELPSATFEGVTDLEGGLTMLKSGELCIGTRGFGDGFAMDCAATDYVDVETNGFDVCGLRPDGSITCNPIETWRDPEDSPLNPVPTGPFASFAVTQDTACALRRDHTLVCWGRGSYGELGARDRTRRVYEVPLREVRSFAVGDQAICATTDGALYCWGGYPTFTSDRPIDVSAFFPDAEGSVTPLRIVAEDGPIDDAREVMIQRPGAGRLCVTRAAGTFYCWGWIEGEDVRHPRRIRVP